MISVLKKMPNSSGAKRLILFHHAGGGGGQYFPSLKPFAGQSEIYCMDLPGRFLRLDEAPFASMTDLLASLRENIEALTPMPTYFLGHSFGALVAYTLAWELHKSMDLRGLGLSALRGSSPESRLGHERLSSMTDTDLVNEIEKFQELPAIVKREPTFLTMTLRALRSDFTVMASFHNPHRRQKLPVPSLVFGGTEDPQVSLQGLSEWQSLVETKKNPLLFAGDHFYIFSQMPNVLSELFQL
jgi:surfactin synthase thioesterase subunit